jgi:hypothetical protein
MGGAGTDQVAYNRISCYCFSLIHYDASYGVVPRWDQHYMVEIREFKTSFTMTPSSCEIRSAQLKSSAHSFPSLTPIHSEFVKAVLKIRCLKWFN